jgi:8-amino-7-oxononanoate synthase
MTHPAAPRDLRAALDALDADSLLRRRRVVRGAQGPVLEVDGHTLIAFASNDYLGLASHPRLAEAVIECVRRNGVGSGASHLISGHHEEHELLEHELAGFVGLPKALAFCTGYMANAGIVPALVGRGDAVFSDALNHACIIDGARLSRADVHVYPHCDLDALETALGRSTAANKLVATDAVFSMDGDVAPLPELVALCERFGAWLLLDDAHGFGVLGPDGAGTLAHFGLRSERVLYMGTLGKAAGVSGAFVAGPTAAIDWLMQRARTYVFTTATPPMVAAAVRASLAIMRDEPWRRERLREHGTTLRARLRGVPWQVPVTPSAIQPVMIGANTAAMATMDALWQRGFWVPAIRPPTVPDGTARLRISFSAEHSAEQVLALADALVAIARHADARAPA